MASIIGVFRKKIYREARYADLKNPLSLFKLIVPIVLVVGGIAIFLTQLVIYLKLVLLLPLLLFAFFVPYAAITMIAEKRKAELEEVLPDALLLISANVRSGLTIDKALLVSARDEFGPLAKEIRSASMEIFGGAPVEKALTKLMERTNSELFAEVVRLIIDGIKSGGEISGLLESSARDIRKTIMLRKEIDANVKMYVLFVTMASVVGAPLLFGISTYLVETTFKVWSGQDFNFSNAGSSMLTITKPTISPGFFLQFAVAAIILTNFFGALIISEIKFGNIKRGYKSVPVYIIIALVVFFVVRYGVEALVGGFIAG